MARRCTNAIVSASVIMRHALEYFTGNTVFSVRVPRDDETVRNYRVELEEDMRALVEVAVGSGNEPFFLDVYEGATHRSVVGFGPRPTYEIVRRVIMDDLAKRPLSR
jgi:hypothetical protein